MWRDKAKKNENAIERDLRALDKLILLIMTIWLATLVLKGLTWLSINYFNFD